MPHTVKKIMLGIIVAGIVAPSLFLVFPQRAKAFPIVSHALSASIPVHETALMKEGWMDIIAYTIAKQFLRLMIREIVGWIQTGDIDGGPLFIQNFKDFFREVRDDSTAIFIDSLLDPAIQTTIPSPFRDIVTEGIITALNTSSVHTPSTLIGLLPDETPFYNDYDVGGLIGFFHIATKPQNQAAGRFLLALEDAQKYGTERNTEAQTETISSEGFKGFADCIGWVEDFANGRSVCISRQIKTPGSNAQDLLASTLESDLDTLELADELDEIIGVIINRLITGILDFDLSDESIDPFAGTYRPIPGDGQPIPGDPCNPNTDVGTSSPVATPQGCQTGGGGGGSGGGGSTPAGGTATAFPICLTNGPPVINISWNIDTGNVTNTLGYVRYCTGICVPTTSSPVACIGTTSCVHTGVTSGGTYTYKVFVYPTLAGPTGTPLTTSTNIPSTTALTCN